MRSERFNLYEDRDDVFLTTYLWDGSPELSGAPRPLILICPGGGYVYCSDREAEPVALRFAAMGYHAAVLRYSVYGDRPEDFARLDSTDPVKPQVLHPAQIRELGRAMLLLRERAGEWNIDAERIAICGFSAGAHVCAMYATLWHRPLICEYLNASPERLRPAAAILCYPVADFVAQDAAEYADAGDRQVTDHMKLAYLGTLNPTREQLIEVSPARNVCGMEPPIFLWATSADTMVPVRNSLNLAGALSERGVPFELHVFERGAHGLCLADQATANCPEQIDPDAARWVPLAEAWLRRRFALNLPSPEQEAG